MVEEDLQELVAGDTINPLKLVLTQLDGVARVNLTNHDVRAFLRGRASNDLPDSAPLIVAGCTITRGQKTISRTTGSFVADGAAVGMIVEAPGFPRGTQLVAVAATTVTCDTVAIAGVAPAAVRFWFGLLCTITSAANGEVEYAGAGAKCDIGALESEVYDVRARIRNTLTDKVGWFERKPVRVVRP